MSTVIWKFNTARFSVVLTAEPEYDLDLSWDEGGEIAEKLSSGLLDSFCAKVAVQLDGREIAADYLCGCIYESAAEFATAHRDPDPMGRNCTIMRAARGEKVNICHYFPGMVSEAIAYARKYLADNPHPKMRAT